MEDFFETNKIYTDKDECTLLFEMKPVSWKRPGRSGERIYDTQFALKEWFRDGVRKGLDETGFGVRYPLAKGVSLELAALFSFPLPRGKTWERGQLCHATIPDLDNLLKFYLDTLQGVLYEDDCSICSIRSEKIYVQQKGFKGMTKLRFREKDFVDTSWWGID